MEATGKMKMCGSASAKKQLSGSKPISALYNIKGCERMLKEGHMAAM